MVTYKKLQQRKKDESKRLKGERETRSSLLILDWKDGKLNVRARKTRARGSINCMSLG